MSVKTIVDVTPDPMGHVWELDWIDIEGNGWRCVLCLVPGYRAADSDARCRKADRLGTLQVHSGVTS